MDKTIKLKSRFRHHEPHTYAFSTTGESKTQQQFKDECDVNNILAKYRKTGMISHLAKHQGNFGDFSTIEDYQTSLAKLQKAEQSFSQLPSELRNKFHNDPAKLIEFLGDKNNDEEAIKYGLKVKIEPKETLQQALEKALETNDGKRAARVSKSKSE